MAQISFIGFVQDWNKDKAPHPKWAMKVTETHSKLDGDTWTVVGRTYRTVKAGWEVTIDFTQFKTGDRVEVIGKEITESTETNGKRYENLVVKADSVTIFSGRNPDLVAAATLDDSPF